MATSSEQKVTSPSVQTVLIAVDDSEQAEQAFEFYVTNIHKSVYNVIMLHVAEVPITASNMYLSADLWEEMLHQERVRAKQVEEKFSAKMKSYNISGKVKTVFYARPGEQIVEQASTEKATLVVMGTRGMGTLRRTILGSVSDYVLHHAHCPVVICRH